MVGYFVFFIIGIAGEIYNFQTVAQRGRYAGKRVGRRDKHDFGHVIRNVQKVVHKVFVLLRVQQLQQGRGGISAPIRPHFVYFVQQENGVGAFGLADTLYNAPGHGADVSAAVAADFALVTYAAQRHAHKLAPDGPRNGLGQRRLAHARRPHKAQHRPAQAFGQLADGQVFQNAFFGFVQAEVVLVQNFLGRGNIQHVLRGDVPGHIHQPVQIGARHRGLRRERGHFLQAFHLFFSRFFGGGRQAVLFNFGFYRVQLFLEIVLLAQFLLNGFHLLIQIIFFLVFLNLRADLRMDFFFQPQNFHLAGDEL